MYYPYGTELGPKVTIPEGQNVELQQHSQPGAEMNTFPFSEHWEYWIVWHTWNLPNHWISSRHCDFWKQWKMTKIKNNLKIFFFIIFLMVSLKSYADTVQINKSLIAVGSYDAAVKIKIFSSLTCPHCANFHMSVIPKIKENYVFFWKNYQFFLCHLWNIHNLFKILFLPC